MAGYFGIEMNIIISKYAYILNKLDIHNIYVEEDFNEIYKDIIPYLNKYTDDTYLNYNITMIILDKLFNKVSPNIFQFQYKNLELYLLLFHYIII